MAWGWAPEFGASARLDASPWCQRSPVRRTASPLTLCVAQLQQGQPGRVPDLVRSAPAAESTVSYTFVSETRIIQGRHSCSAKYSSKLQQAICHPAAQRPVSNQHSGAPHRFRTANTLSDSRTFSRRYR